MSGLVWYADQPELFVELICDQPDANTTKLRLQQAKPVTNAPTQHMSFRLFIAIGAASLAACGTTVMVQSAADSKSQFDGAVYSGVVTEVAKPNPNAELYRVFQQGATGFVPVSGVRGGVEELANNYCAKKGGAVRLVRETTSPGLLLPGNFPRVEWLFECENSPVKERQADRLDQLEKLKRLLDNGTLTQQEFEAEKAKILAETR